MDGSGPDVVSTCDCVIDCRSRLAFEQGHLPGSLWLPWPQLSRMKNALPPPGHRVVLIDPPDAACRWLSDQGYTVTCLSASALTGSLLETGLDQGVCFHPSPPLVEMLRHWSCHGRVLDMGCGGGRDAIWLARRGWLVTGIERAPRALSKARALARHYGVSVNWHRCNLRSDDCLPAGRFDLILMMRFLLPERFEWMQQRLRPGGRVIVWAFHETAAHPANPALKTTPKKLMGAFDRLTPVTAKITKIEDGRPMTLYIGEKP